MEFNDKASIHNFCLHSGTAIIGDCMKEVSTAECINHGWIDENCLNGVGVVGCINNARKVFELSLPLGACFCSAMYETFYSTFSTAYMFCTKPSYSSQDGARDGRLIAKPDPETFLIDLDLGKGPSNWGIPKNHINDVLAALGTSLGQKVMGKFPKVT